MRITVICVGKIKEKFYTDAPMSCTSALSGKLGMIDGVTAKCNTAKI